MLALTINSTRYRNLRGGVGHDVVAKDLARHCDPARIGSRGQDGRWKVARLLSGSKVFGLAMALPPTTLRRIAVNLAILASLLPATVTGTYSRIAFTGQQMLCGALAGAFGIMAFYAYKMGISWRPRVAAIMRGFAVILIVNLAMAVLKGRTQGHLARVADDAGQIVYRLSYVYWAWCFFWGRNNRSRVLLRRSWYTL